MELPLPYECFHSALTAHSWAPRQRKRGQSSHKSPGKGPVPVTQAEQATVNAGLIVACVSAPVRGAVADRRRRGWVFSAVEPKGFLFKTVPGLTETVYRLYSEA